MTDYDLKGIESTIGYTFNNKDLLKQAFIRKSANELTNNELFSFIGDKVLDILFLKHLTIIYGKQKNIDNFKGYRLLHKEYYASKFKNLDYSLIRKEIEDYRLLAKAIDNLGYINFLECNNEDIDNDKIKSDLAKAIIGAIAIDSAYEIDDHMLATDIMLDIDSFIFHNDIDEERYFKILLDWSISNNYGIPIYSYNYLGHSIFECTMTLPNHAAFKLIATGNNEANSRRKAAKVAYKVLIDNGFISNPYRDAIGKLSYEDSLIQLDKLVDSNLISKPIFTITNRTDNDGTVLYTCSLSVKECPRIFTTYDLIDIEEAKKECAYNILKWLTGDYNFDE